MKSNQLLLGFISAVLFTPSILQAHVPYFENDDNTKESPFVITTPLDTSIAIYAHFAKAFEMNFYEFNVSSADVFSGDIKGKKIHLGTLVPRCNAYKNIYPKLAVVGPEQNTITTLETPVIDNRDDNAFFEEHSRTWYWNGAKSDLVLTEVGKYSLIIWEQNGKIGDYVVEFGDVEKWGIKEILRATVAMPKLLLHKEIANEECRQEVGQR